MALDHSCQAQRHSLSDRKNDLDETPVGGISRKQHTHRSPAAAARIVASNFWAGVNSIMVLEYPVLRGIRHVLDIDLVHEFPLSVRRYPNGSTD